MKKRSGSPGAATTWRDQNGAKFGFFGGGLPGIYRTGDSYGPTPTGLMPTGFLGFGVPIHRAFLKMYLECGHHFSRGVPIPPLRVNWHW